MKVARFLLPLALLSWLTGASYGQMPMDPAMMGGPGMGMEPCPVYDDAPALNRVFQRTSRGYFSADAFFVHRKNSAPRTIVMAGGIERINTSQLDFGWETAPRITGGFVLGNDIAVEATAFYKDDLDAHADFVGAGALLSPVFAIISNASGVPLAASNYVGADSINVQESTGIHSYEFNVVETGRVFNFLSGLRYIELRDVLSVTAAEGVALSNSRIGTYNHLYGGHMGFRSGYNWELVGIEAGAKAGYFINDAQSTLVVGDVNNVTRRNVRTAGQNDSFAGEVTCKISYRPLPYLAITGGYNCFWITETALAPDQLNTANPAASGLALNAHGDMFYHGPSVGVDLRW